jgi:hypothetical protein
MRRRHERKREHLRGSYLALVGLQSKIVTESTYAIVVFMTAVTTILAPPLLRLLFRNEGRQRKTIASVA